MNRHIANAGLTPNDKAHIERINYRFDCAEIICAGEREIGLLKVVKEDRIWDLVQIQLVAPEQGKGIGTKIIQELIRQAYSHKASVKLSVYKSNPAKDLYLKLGFKTYLETETTYEMLADNNQA